MNKAPKYSLISFSIRHSSSNHALVSSSKLAIKFLLLRWLALQWKYLVFWSPSFNQSDLDLYFHMHSSLLLSFSIQDWSSLIRPRLVQYLKILSIFQLSETTLQSVPNMSKSVTVPHLKPLLTRNNVLVKVPHQGRPFNLLP